MSAAPSEPPGLEYMPEQELDEFIESNPELGLTQQETEFLYIRRRRLSVERSLQVRPNHHPPWWVTAEGVRAQPRGGRAESAAVPAPVAPEANPPFKVVVLGDEETSGKISMLELFALYPARPRHPPLHHATSRRGPSAPPALVYTSGRA